MPHPPPDAQRDVPGCDRDRPRPPVRARCATWLARKRSRLRSSNLVAGEPPLKIATHLSPGHCLARGDNLSVPLLGRSLELSPALFLFGLLGYRFQNETVRGGSSPFCCASDALLKILRQANGGCGHGEAPCEKCSVAQLCYIERPTSGSVASVGSDVTTIGNALGRRCSPVHRRAVQLSRCVHTICTRRIASA